MNFYNITRATRGLVAYLEECFGIGFQPMKRQSGPPVERTRPVASSDNRQDADATAFARPKLVIAHDTRFFSKEFANLTAKVASENGCDALIFAGPRSTPELSFAVRHLKASAGVVITASHNPPHDNGYKVYFSDGAQVIEPHASSIIAKVDAIPNETFT